MTAVNRVPQIYTDLKSVISCRVLKQEAHLPPHQIPYKKHHCENIRIRFILTRYNSKCSMARRHAFSTQWKLQ